MKKAIVLGGGGFIGGHLARRLKSGGMLSTYLWLETQFKNNKD